MKKDSAGNKTEPILGFFISGNGTSNADSRPSAIGNWRLTDDAITRLNADPLRNNPISTGTLLNHEFIRLDDFQRTPTRMNAGSNGINLAGKIDVNTGANINLAFGGTLNYGTNRNYSYSNSLMNWDNNSESINSTWRAWGRFTHRLGSKDPKEEAESKKVVKNAFYSVQVDYQKVNSTNWDAKHKDNLFDYGYVGKFKTLQAKNYGLQEDYNYNGTVLSSAYVLQAYTDTIVQYYPNEEINPNLNAFTASYYENTGYNGIDDYDYNSAINPHSGGNTGGVWYDPDHPDNPDKYWDQIRGANDPWRDINQIRLGGGLYNGDAAPSIYGCGILGDRYPTAIL